MIRIADIQRVVAGAYGVSVADLKEPDGLGAREPTKVRPRQISMFLARTQILSTTYGDGTRPISLYRIGRSFGNRDHSTVFHAVKSIAEERQKSKKLDILLSNLERQIKAVDELHREAFLDSQASA